MWNLLKHLRDQLLYDEEAAKNRLAAARTWLYVIGAHILVVTGGTINVAFSWSKKEWAGAIVTAFIAAGARAALPVVPKTPPAPQP